MLEREMSDRDDSTPHDQLVIMAKPSELYCDMHWSFDEDSEPMPKPPPKTGSNAGQFDDDWLDTPFYAGEWRPGLCDFTIWSPDRVYFPAQYDSHWRCASVPRNPCGEAVSYVGGG
jgi:hypothetical protein